VVVIRQNRGLSVDLHVHTPRSTCYRDKEATAQNIVEAAIKAGLDAIAITDHNTTAAVEEVKSVASKCGLMVFPGVEVSTVWGHVLAIFAAETANGVVDGLLERIGITPEDRGDGGRLAKIAMEQVFKVVTDAGGIAIAAHVDRWPTGVLHSGASAGDKARLLSSVYLSAVEITIPGDKNLWNNGGIPNISTKLACIQSSDAHSPYEIGRRRVKMTMNETSLDGIREALSNHSTAIEFPR
jgi:PHP family Zn ribbon phosphoesterase